jgi:hypothetical protein
VLLRHGPEIIALLYGMPGGVICLGILGRHGSLVRHLLLLFGDGFGKGGGV